MKTLVAFAVATLLANGTAQAASIIYEHPFTVESEDEFFPGFPPDPSGDRHYVPLGTNDEWTIPLFDFSLGVPEVLLIEIEGIASISGRFHDLGGLASVNPFVGFAVLGVPNPIEPDPVHVLFFGDSPSPCTEPCDFVASAEFGDEGFFYPITPDMFPVVVPLGFYGADNFVTYEIAASATLRSSISGVAHATYLYEPFAEPVPEPATITLLGTGLAAALVKSRRRNKRTRVGYPSLH